MSKERHHPPDPKTASLNELQKYWRDHDPVRKWMGRAALAFMAAAGIAFIVMDGPSETPDEPETTPTRTEFLAHGR